MHLKWENMEVMSGQLGWQVKPESLMKSGGMSVIQHGILGVN